jgi:hypothetical protein
MKDSIISSLTGKEINPQKMVRILNIYQATYYISRGIMPEDLYSSSDYRTGDPRLVFLFDREKSHEVYDAWCLRNKKIKEANSFNIDQENKENE